VARQDPQLLTKQPVLVVDGRATSSICKKDISFAIGSGQKQEKTEDLPESMRPTWKRASEGHTASSTLGQDRLHHFQAVNMLPLRQKWVRSKQSSKKKYTEVQASNQVFMYKVDEWPNHRS